MEHFDSQRYPRINGAGSYVEREDRYADYATDLEKENARLRAALLTFADADRWREDLIEAPDGLEPTGSYIWDVEDVAPWAIAQGALKDTH